MKQLFLLRHAKSSWEDPDLADFDRPLNGRGRVVAPFMGELIARRTLLPDVIVSSPAKRAAQTAELVKENSGFNVPLRFDERIYEASPQGLRQVVAELTDDVGSVMLVGHNPGMEGFIRFLTGEDEAMPTAALAHIDLDIKNWPDIAAKSGALRSIIRPKEEMKRADAGK